MPAPTKYKVESEEVTNPKAGWQIKEWCTATSISRAGYYTLAIRPQAVKIGRRTVVTESPQSYLQRIAGQSQVQA